MGPRGPFLKTDPETAWPGEGLTGLVRLTYLKTGVGGQTIPWSERLIFPEYLSGSSNSRLRDVLLETIMAFSDIKELT